MSRTPRWEAFVRLRSSLRSICSLGGVTAVGIES